MATFELSRDDCFAASWFVQRRFRRKLVLVFAVGASLIMVGLCAGGRPWHFSAAVAATVFALPLALRLYLNRRRIYRVYDDHLADEGAATLTLDADGFAIAMGGTSVATAWEKLQFWSEDERFLFLFRGRDFAQVIPKSALSEDEESLLRSKVSNLRKL